MPWRQYYYLSFKWYTVDIYSNLLPDHFRCSDFGHLWCPGPPGPMGSPDKEEDIIVTRETFFDPPPLNEKYKEPPAKVRHPKLCKKTCNVQLSDPVTVTSEFQNQQHFYKLCLKTKTYHKLRFPGLKEALQLTRLIIRY